MVCWIQLARNKDSWRASVNTLSDIRSLQNVENFVIVRETDRV